MHQRLARASTNQHCRRRELRFEALEPRHLLAGDTYLINFQNDEATPPTRYLVDTGQTFGLRDGGFSYGWSSDHTDQARERSLHPDQRLDTLIHFELGQFWEFQLANGVYEVTVTVGDPANNDGLHTINVEGVNFLSAVPDANSHLTVTGQVTVSDGRLTIDQGSAADRATRIDYVHIVGVASGVNAAPAIPAITEPAVDGHVAHPADVHMEAIGFSDPDGNLHKSTDWEIWTVGAGAHPIWQTLGIEGVERLHTHLGDGIFIGALAGQTSLAPNTDYELRVRFRDDAGSVSDWAQRSFSTSAASATQPMQLPGVVASPAPTWQTTAGANVELPAGTAILSPGDFIIGIDLNGGSASPGDETPPMAIDQNIATKYLNFGEENSGFIVTPSYGASIVTSFQVSTANDATARDPASWQLFGTNQTIVSTNHSTGTAETWTLIDTGTFAGANALPLARNTPGPVVTVNNNTAYTSYRMIFPTVRSASQANSMQFSEIQFFADQSGTPGSLRLEAGGDVLFSITGTDLAGNMLSYFPPVGGHLPVRIVLQAGSNSLALPRTDLSVTDSQGVRQTIYLPAVNVAAGQRVDLWVSLDGSTYWGNAAQTEPNFSFLARSANVDVPFVALQPGYVIDVVGTGYRLPVNIAFVPDPGPNPNDPLYYVTELYGSIQVVTRDGAKHEFATGLLDYNPQGPISGSGEQGLTGIAVRRDPLNPDVYQLFVGMLWDNGAPPGGAVHYPKVERIDSAPGGLTMAARSVLLNMQPETQGQSHQISNVSIGPDGKLYVHMGDGFNAGTALNLEQFRGKILRMNLDGTAPGDNPFYNAADGITPSDYVFAYGVRNPFGGAWRAADGKHYEVENGPSVDRLARIERGVSYGWNGSDASMFINALYNWTSAHAPVNITFVQPETFAGSQFPASKQDVALVSESGPTYAAGPQTRGKRIVEFRFDASGNVAGAPVTLVEYVGTGRGSVVGLAAGPDGLYFTELYEDTGASGPTAAGARIFRVRYINTQPGDYNIDGVVNGADYAVWRSTLGSNLLLAADGNGNGIVDTADYIMWRKNSGAGAASAAVETGGALDAALVMTMSQEPVDAENSGLASSVEQAVHELFAERPRTLAKAARVLADRAMPSISSARHDLLLALAEAANEVAGARTSDAKALASHDHASCDLDEAFARLRLRLFRLR